MNQYDSTIGYSDLDDINPDKAKQTIFVIKTIIDHHSIQDKDSKILVAGCGNGTEAALLCEAYNAPTIGVDISLEATIIPEKGKLSLQKQDLMNLTFQDQSYSLIYSYHVLEHVPDHIKVLKELFRVLSSKGTLFIGFPNKNRLIGYIGTHQNVSMLDKIRWNLTDYKKKLLGQFENRLGAHAGFSQKEFLKDAGAIYQEVIPVRNEYMRLKYANHIGIINFLIASGLSKYLFPSNYYICKKKIKESINLQSL